MSAVTPLVTLRTPLGDIVLRLEPVRAPQTVANFIAYVRGEAYTNGRFFRTVTTEPDNQPDMSVRIDVIEAEAAAGARRLPGVAFEPTSVTGILHKDGTVSMSRDAALDSATSNFFICVGDQPQLDDGGMPAIHGLFARGFATFGNVVGGMDVVRAIHQSSRSGQTLTPSIEIVSVTTGKP